MHRQPTSTRIVPHYAGAAYYTEIAGQASIAAAALNQQKGRTYQEVLLPAGVVVLVASFENPLATAVQTNTPRSLPPSPTTPEIQIARNHRERIGDIPFVADPLRFFRSTAEEALDSPFASLRKHRPLLAKPSLTSPAG